jgi:hypothetical protein
MKSPSKKAFKHNIEAEMNAHPAPEDRKRNIAIAYAVQRKAKNKRKMAEGGSISASNEKRPMPDNRYDDSKMVSQNSGNKAPKNDQWLDQPTVQQAKANDSRRVLPIKRPKMVPSNAFSTRLYDEEGRLQESAGVNEGPQIQPPKHDDEEGADRQGPKVSDMEDEHSTHRKPYAKGGQIDDMDHPSKHDMEPADHEIQEREREDEAHLMSMEEPSEDEGRADAMSRNEMSPNRHGDEVPDMEDEHSTGRKPYAGGGRIGDDIENMDHDMELNPAHGKYSKDDSEDQPSEEEHEERYNSIAAACMARMQQRAQQYSDSDIDEQMRLASGGSVESGSRDMNYAEGGEILKHSNSSDIKSKRSIDSDDSSQVDLSRNADEDANEEDQLSYNSLRKENYNESEGLAKLDQPRDSNLKGDSEEDESENKYDRISAIRSKMNMKRQFSK